MSKRKIRVLTVSYLAAAFLITAGFALKMGNQAGAYHRTLQYGSERAFGELASSVSDMEVSLTKSLCAASPELFTACCADVYAKSLTAQAALGQLPDQGQGLEATASFLSKAGSYSLSLAKSAAGGNGPGEKDYENLAALQETAGALTQDLMELYHALRTGSISLEQLSEDAEDAEDLNPSLLEIEEAFPALPTLIHDGPFSDEEQEPNPKQLQGLSDVSEEDALAAAAEFTGWEELTPLGLRESEIPVYVFQAEVNGETHIAEVTKQGGRVITMRSTEAAHAQNLSQEEASQIAAEFLHSHGFENMAESYHQIEAGHSVILYVCQENGVLLYPDMVKVAVSLDTGHVSGFDCAGYLGSHTQRILPGAVIAEETAMETVSPWLTPEASTLAVIPGSGDKELYCYEILCTAKDGRHCMVYVNAVTGEEEKILILIENESGTLTR